MPNVEVIELLERIDRQLELATAWPAYRSDEWKHETTGLLVELRDALAARVDVYVLLSSAHIQGAALVPTNTALTDRLLAEEWKAKDPLHRQIAVVAVTDLEPYEGNK